MSRLDTWWQAASGAICWRAEGQNAKVDGFDFSGAWVPATRHPNTEAAKAFSWICGSARMLKVSCLPPWPSARHQTTPLPVVRWLQGAGFCLFPTLNLLHWVRPDPSRRHRFIRSRESRNSVTTGPVGRFGLDGARKRLSSQQHFSDSTRFSGTLETGPSPPRTFVDTWLHKTGRLMNADRPGQPEPPGSARCSIPSTSKIPRAWTFIGAVEPGFSCISGPV